MDIIIKVCFFVALALSFYELVGVAAARVKGLTKSTARVVVRGVIFFSLAGLLWQYRNWLAYIASFDFQDLLNARLGNTPFIICASLIAVVLLLVLQELASLYRAKRRRLTKNISRFVTALLILLALLPILRATLVMWDDYVNVLQGNFQDRAPSPE